MPFDMQMLETSDIDLPVQFFAVALLCFVCIIGSGSGFLSRACVGPFILGCSKSWKALEGLGTFHCILGS